MENTSSSSSSLTGLFEETCILVGIQFFFIIMASTSKAFNKCVDPCPRYLRWHTQSLRLLFGQGARTLCPWGENLCATSSTFAGRRHMIGKVVTGCVAILPYHTARHRIMDLSVAISVSYHVSLQPYIEPIIISDAVYTGCCATNK